MQLKANKHEPIAISAKGLIAVSLRAFVCDECDDKVSCGIFNKVLRCDLAFNEVVVRELWSEHSAVVPWERCVPMCSDVLMLCTFSVKGNIKGANTSPLRIKHHRTAHQHQSNAVRNMLSSIENYIGNNISIVAAKNATSLCIALNIWCTYCSF